LKIDSKRITTLFVIYFSFACAGATELLKEEYSRMFSEPSSAKNIFANIKTALDENLLLSKSFYEEKNIYWIIGDHEASKRGPGEHNYLFTSSKTSKLSCPVRGRFNRSIRESENSAFKNKEKFTNGNIYVNFLDTSITHTSQIPVSCEQFNIDALIKIFGPPSEERNIFDETGRSPPLHGVQGYVLGLRTHPLGNKHLTFIKNSPENISYEVSVEVTGAGVIKNLFIHQSQREILL
jgi:hypothetical protein